jgi:hypothetical protein
MPHVQGGIEDSADIEIHHNNHGAGKPIGWTHPDDLNAARLDFLGR